ncbi:MAG: hypothetical protein ACI9BO_002534 [Zhongshania sp.]|jgi:hypothetical protein
MCSLIVELQYYNKVIADGILTNRLVLGLETLDISMLFCK